MYKVLEQISDAFFALDHDWTFIYLNAQAEILLQRSREDLLGQNVWEEFPEAVDALFYQHYHRAVREQATVTFEAFYDPLDTWFNVRAYPTEDGLSVYFQNINQQKQAAKELQASQERLNRIIETKADGLAIINLDGQISFANAAAEQILGLERDAITNRTYNDPGWSISDINGNSLPEDQLPFMQAIQQQQAVYDIEFAILHPGGRQVLISANAAPLLDEHGAIEAVMVSFTDRTEYKRTQLAQDLLVRAGALFMEELDTSTLIEKTAELIVPTFADWCVIHLLEGGKLKPISVVKANSMQDEFIQAIEQVYNQPVSQAHPLYSVLNHNDSVLIDRCREPQLSHSVLWNFLQAYGCNGFLVVPLVARQRTLGVLTLVSMSLTRPYTAHHLGVAQELARRLSLVLENRQLYENLEDVLHSRDELFSMVTHDLKNPLGAITGYADLLARRFKRYETISQDKALPTLERIRKAGDKMNRLLDELLDVASIHEQSQLVLRQETFDLVKLIKILYDLYKDNSDHHRIQLKTKLSTLMVYYDQARIERVVDNLISNAIKYSPCGGNIIIRLAQEIVDGKEWVVLSVQDFGIGILPNDLEHVFGRFERGSNVGEIKGNGIGLSSAKYIVEQHQGSLQVLSVPDQGSTFVVRLPVLHEPAE